VLIDSSGSAFLKMTGPDAVVGAQIDAFRKLASSMRRETASAMAPPSSAPNPSSALAWAVPTGWRKGPDKPGRAVTFFVGPNDAVECYVTMFPGDGGGALANVNRWRKQLGRDEITAEKLEELHQIPMLGGQAWLAEIDGTFTDSTGQKIPDALLFGAVYAQQDRSVFVKLVGPKAVVEPQHEAFVAFCSSLKPGP
jgi:hypothetical protein